MEVLQYLGRCVLCLYICTCVSRAHTPRMFGRLCASLAGNWVRLRKPGCQGGSLPLAPSSASLPCFALPSLCLLLSQPSLGTAGFSQTPTCPGYVSSFRWVNFYPCLLLPALPCRVCVQCDSSESWLRLGLVLDVSSSGGQQLFCHLHHS